MNGRHLGPYCLNTPNKVFPSPIPEGLLSLGNRVGLHSMKPKFVGCGVNMSISGEWEDNIRIVTAPIWIEFWIDPCIIIIPIIAKRDKQIDDIWILFS